MGGGYRASIPSLSIPFYLHLQAVTNPEFPVKQYEFNGTGVGLYWESWWAERKEEGSWVEFSRSIFHKWSHHTHTHTHKILIKNIVSIWEDFFLLFSWKVVPDSLWPHGLQHPRNLWPLLSPWVCSNSFHWVEDAI